MQRCIIDANGERQLLALVATCTPSRACVTGATAMTDSSAGIAINPTTAATETHASTSPLAALADSDAASVAAAITPLPAFVRVDDVLVYLHGFPDMAVHPTRLEFASRMSRKLAESWLGTGASVSANQSARTTHNAAVDTPKRTLAFVTFNFGGVPGSDNELRFAHKTIAKEVDDAVAVCAFVRQHLLRVGPTCNSDGSACKEYTRSDSTIIPKGQRGRVHVVGLSTGAIIASLLRDKGVADTITAIAGVADVAQTVPLDFSPMQLAQFDRDGACWKEFYLPNDVPAPQHAVYSLDGEHETSEDLDSDSAQLNAVTAAQTRKLYLRLSRTYIDECRSGTLDIARAVSHESLSLPPLLVIHGDADTNVPIAHGEALFRIASEPKTFVTIARANHLLTNTKHMKRAVAAIIAHTLPS